MNLPQTEIVSKFMSRVEITDKCWNWKGGKNIWGYGQFHFDNHQNGAHRFAYKTFNGPIPDKLYVCHQCDNPACVRPTHLFLGTSSDNRKDCFRKGRFNQKRNALGRFTEVKSE